MSGGDSEAPPDELLKQPNCPFVMYVGTRKLVKCKAFEEFIEERIAI